MRTYNRGMSDHSILIVDDSPTAVRSIKEHVARWDIGFSAFYTASNGLEGLEVAVARKPHLVLADVAMPVMDGLRMAESIVRELPDTKIIFMSCHSEFEYARRALSIHAAGYIMKPINLVELHAVLSSADQSLRQAESRLRMELELNNKLSQSIPILYEQLFFELLTGPAITEETVRARLCLLDLDHLPPWYTVVIVACEDRHADPVAVDGAADPPASGLARAVVPIKSHLYSQLRAEMPVFVLTCHVNAVTAVVFPNGETRAERSESLERSMATLVCTIEESTGARAVAGIGAPSERLSELRTIFHQAEYALTDRFFMGDTRVFRYTKPVVHAPATLIDVDELRNRLTEILDLGDVDALSAFFVDLFRDPKEFGTEAGFKRVCFILIDAMRSYLATCDASDRSFWTNEGFSWNAVARLSSVETAREWTDSIVGRAGKTLRDRVAGDRYRIMVRRIEQVLDRWFHSVNRAKEEIANLGLSVGYSGYLLKKYTGLTIFEYVTRKRLETAKSMLSDPYVKVYEVAERTGFSSVSYFSTVFKEQTGVTPKEYMNRNARTAP